MTIQHASIPDVYLHEPKGVVTATSGQAYHANGAGSGAWRKSLNTDIQGLTGDGGSTNQKIVTDGANGFVMKQDSAFGSMVITNNTNAFTTVAASDSTLNTNSDYQLLTGTGAPWAPESLYGGTTFNTNRITVPVTGYYRVDLWATIAQWPSASAKVSVKYRINGTTFVTRHPLARSPGTASDPGALSGFGLALLTAGDFLQIYIAATASGNLIFSDLNTTIELMRQTP